MFWNQIVGDVCLYNLVNVLKATELYTDMVKMVKFVLYKFYLNNKVYGKRMSKNRH